MPSSPRWLSAQDVVDALGWGALIEAIERAAVDEDVRSPERTLHAIEAPGAADGTLLLKPAWKLGDVIAIKAVTVFGDNGARGLPMVNAGVLLFDATTGVLLGACEGNELTRRRTAAASAVAAKRLAPVEAHRLLVIGTGALSPMVAQAHASVRPITSVAIWGRRPERAVAVADELSGVFGDGVSVSAASAEKSLDELVASADVISCVTGANEALVRGGAVTAGTHVDLVGAFSGAMRESDDALISRARVWVDTRPDALIAGDLASPIAAGKFDAASIEGDLASLVGGAELARSSDEEVTVFKSVGTALEDLAAAKLAFAR